ncbi:MAG: MerR family transcriptional regulator, partial [Rhizobiales bacterium]|nr:MerR family transcriptional regulator [Hyphomicrobiales bacterium]
SLPDASCQDVIRIAEHQMEAVQIRIARLRVLKAELGRIIRHCAGGKMADCRIIEALSAHELHMKSSRGNPGNRGRQ